jgi:signal transduction histidine kinase
LRQWLTKATLPARFLAVSAAVVASAMLLLGGVVSHYAREGILTGVATTAAASVDSIVSNYLDGIALEAPLSAADRSRLDSFFEISSDSDSARLMQIRIRRLDSGLLYEASSGIVDLAPDESIQLAIDGEVSSDLVNVPLDPLGPFGTHDITLLRLVTPLHRPASGDVFAVAILYYSARSVLSVQFNAQLAVWVSVLLTGLAVIGVLYALVLATNRTITLQRHRLAVNLERSRRLARQVQGLHATSEALRVEAIEANEQLLARVGSDIHDGPLQLLTLAILQLSRTKPGPAPGTGGIEQVTALASDAMNELRNISAGLVLPELAGLTLSQTIELAISRHEAATGVAVQRMAPAGAVEVDNAVQICIYRVVQESLANGFRHADGLEQQVGVEVLAGYAIVTISNRRTHLPSRAPADGRPRLGLRGMQLRIEAVGGGLQVEMGSQKVTVTARLPILGG